MDHGRRRFVFAMQAGDARASIAVALIAKLYVVEATRGAMAPTSTSCSV